MDDIKRKAVNAHDRSLSCAETPALEVADELGVRAASMIRQILRSWAS